MIPKCCVCNNSRQDAVLHCLPKSEKILNKWFKSLIRDDLRKLSRKNVFVCHIHFERRFISSSEKRLKYEAYPTLFTNAEISSGIPSSEETENKIVLEHNYSRKRHYDHTYAMREPLTENCNVIEVTNDFHDVPGPSSSHQYSGVSAFDTLVLEKAPGISPNPVKPTLASNTNQTEDTDLSNIQLKKSKANRKRIIQRLNRLSPICRTIHAEYKKAKQQADYNKRAKSALKLIKKHSFEKLTANMNQSSKTFLEMQLKLCSKNRKGRRFTAEEKLIALSIMKQSPKCYKFLHKIFILPSKTTLNAMVAKLRVETGICPQIFELLKKEVAEWDNKKRMCSIIFDEMSLESGLTYDKHKDHINGFVELDEKKAEFADHALVFMLRGAVYKWQQPIVYYYCQGATSGLQLKAILRDVVSAVAGCGLTPVAIICDQGAAFQSALKSFKEETTREQILGNQEPDGTISISGINMSIIYDPSHLIKGLRNNFLTKNIILDGKVSRWSDIVDVYETDCNHADTRLLHKLTDQHVIPDKIKKMKVKNCVKVFSSTVSAALLYTSKFSHYTDGRPVSSTIKNTAEIVLFFDKLFDSVNGAATFSKKTVGKPLRTAVSEKSPHHSFWRDASRKLKLIKFIDAAGKQKSVPSLFNFVVTLNSYMRLWQFFKNEGIIIMRPRYFNSDPIENFFGQVRAYNYRHNDPNCHSFNCTFKSLLITRIIKFHNETFNCEDDQADQVINLTTLFDETNVPSHPTNARNIEMIVEQARRERINVHSRAYTAGWVVKKLFQKFNVVCSSCKSNLLSDKSNIHEWISTKEYRAEKRSLNYPSEGAVRCFSTVIKETNEYLEQNAHLSNISKNIKTMILSKYSFDFIDCSEHRMMILDHFICLTVRFGVVNWCSTINRILKGTDIHRLRNRVLPAMQQKAYHKYQKKLKNKFLNK